MLRYAIVIAVVLVGALALPRMQHYHGGRIVNGTDAKLGQYPFMASLQYKGFPGSHFCAASIVNENYVVTTAFCIDYQTPARLAVVVGTVDLTTGGTFYEVARCEKNGAYSGPENNFMNDLAVCKVATPIVFNDLVQPAPFPEQDHPTPGGTPAISVGFGYPYSGGDITNHLQEVELAVYSDDDCQPLLNYRPFDSNICAGVPEGGKGNCGGDSGGPLVVNGLQVGIATWHEEPCGAYPGVYMEASHFINWLIQHTTD